jgi:archaellum biogenesis protein FlaJ (TadC family)
MIPGRIELRERLSGLAAVVDFFIPMEVLSSVLLIFAMENVLNTAVAATVGDGNGMVWVLVYIAGLSAVSALNYVSADDDELEEFHDDLDDVR